MSESQAVRFSSNNMEISPESSLEPVRSITRLDNDGRELNPEAEEELRQLKSTLQSGLQSKRMEHYSFEPVSLPNSQPVSRVHSLTLSRLLTACLHCLGSFWFKYAQTNAGGLCSTFSKTITTTI